MTDPQPQSIEAEREVLAACLAFPKEAVPLVLDRIAIEDLYVHRHRLYYRAIRQLTLKELPVDPITLQQCLKDAGRWGESGGNQMLGALCDARGALGNLEYYCTIVRDKALKRAIIDAGSQLLHIGRNEALMPVEAVAAAEAALKGATQRRVSKGWSSCRDVVKAYLEECEQKRDGKVEGVCSGIPALDRVTHGGLQPGWLVCVLARPGMGKTALATNNYARYALRHKQPVYVVSLDMTEREVVGRMLAAESRIPLARHQEPEADDASNLVAAAAVVAEWPLFVDDGAEGELMSIEYIRVRARRLAREVGQLGLIVVDYVQKVIMRSAGKETSRVEQLDYIVNALKALGKELNCPVLMLSQPDKLGGMQKGPLRLGRSKGSQALDAEPDLILSPYRPYVDEPGEDPSTTELGMAKFRHYLPVDLKTWDIRFNGDRLCFEGNR